MAIEKALSPLPENMQAEGTEVDLEIEVINPEMVTLDDGSVEIMLVPDAGGGKDEEDEFYPSIHPMMQTRGENRFSLESFEKYGFWQDDSYCQQFDIQNAPLNCMS